MVNEYDERGNNDDCRKDDEKPQIVQLNANDLTKEQVDIELAKAKEGIALKDKFSINLDYDAFTSNRKYPIIKTWLFFLFSLKCQT